VPLAVVHPLRPERRRRQKREAQRRWRARQKKLQASYRVDAGPAVLNMLVRRKYIDDHETENAMEVGKAISLFMNDHAELDNP
jgi:hypothetical protein